MNLFLDPSSPRTKVPWVRLTALALATLAVHLVVAVTTAYGLHRDEYLYLAMGGHLDWGYMEGPPGIALIAAGLQATIGTSLEAVRLVPGLGHAVLVGLTGLLAWELGGKHFSILLAGLAALIAPVYLRAGTLFQPVVFDQLAWTGAALFVARRVRTDDPRYWFGAGVACGLGLVFKYTILLFGAGLAVGLLLTPLRRDLATPWPWTGAAVGGAFAAPILAWQVAHDWPLLRHLQALSESQLAHVGALDFLKGQVLMMNPVTLPLWGAGLIVLFTRRGRRFRVFGWIFVACLGLLLVLNGKPYYLAPAYPMLLAPGGRLVEHLGERIRNEYWRPVLVGTLLVSGIALGPMGVPILPPPVMAEYLETIGIAPRSETGERMALPQDYADMLGWREMAHATADIYDDLPQADRSRAVLFGETYGHAGALDYYGESLGLPSAVAASGSYYVWGPGDQSGDVTVFLGLPKAVVGEYFARCTTERVVRHRWAREAKEPIVVCREIRQPFPELWPAFDSW